tara:strand:+ start:77 stop:460 length:384 start_codon:yes stop_codon:yes gene_type:complete
MTSKFEFNKIFTKEELEKFIEISGDKAAFHSDSAAAIKAGFETNICHGVMTLMPISRVLGMIMPGEGYIILELGTKFHLPAYCDKQYSYKFEETYSNKDLGISKISISIFNEINQKISVTNATCKKV